MKSLSGMTIRSQVVPTKELEAHHTALSLTALSTHMLYPYFLCWTRPSPPSSPQLLRALWLHTAARQSPTPHNSSSLPERRP